MVIKYTVIRGGDVFLRVPFRIQTPTKDVRTHTLTRLLYGCYVELSDEALPSKNIDVVIPRIVKEYRL